MNARLYLWQRGSALVMAPLVAIHLGLIVYAVHDGLTASEILARTRGSVIWGGYYTAFVLAAAVHAGIGLRTVFGEWGGATGKTRDSLAIAAGLVLATLGLRAVYAVIAA